MPQVVPSALAAPALVLTASCLALIRTLDTGHKGQPNEIDPDELATSHFVSVSACNGSRRAVER